MERLRGGTGRHGERVTGTNPAAGPGVAVVTGITGHGRAIGSKQQLSIKTITGKNLLLQIAIYS
jgi:hypothetical protein